MNGGTENSVVIISLSWIQNTLRLYLFVCVFVCLLYRGESGHESNTQHLAMGLIGQLLQRTTTTCAVSILYLSLIILLITLWQNHFHVCCICSLLKSIMSYFNTTLWQNHFHVCCICSLSLYYPTYFIVTEPLPHVLKVFST